MSTEKLPRIFLARHGQTEWSLSGQHTSSTDLPLTSHGEGEAAELKRMLAGHSFARVWSSPRLRARRTCELVGLSSQCVVVDDLTEWNYGDDEGRTTADIREDRPGWQIFDDGPKNGESLLEIATRIERVIARLRQYPTGDSIIFSHGHLLRALGGLWVGQSLSFCQHLSLSTASLSMLGYDGAFDHPNIQVWNATAIVVR